MSQADLPVLRVAYMPLIDCAPLVAAQRLDLDRVYGLKLDLQRQAWWTLPYPRRQRIATSASAWRWSRRSVERNLPSAVRADPRAAWA
ncbi:hypothetical protein AE921_05155 [Xanthomonas arboricola]|uniref:Uncharacterized protein n=1 Tax=Xanthomonas arboricola pv. corylina TaxID=487821 RepID=A0A2S7CDA0_9XANT|nr:hypothetical protein AE920_09380 [Xanthomonas arboricola]OAH78725.1 hypothetical protein AXA70_09640 [Xanthomonas arboricola pv. juglandis]PPU11213.1 hypothetical protein XacyCFBP2565_18475 [Xanthomonas arboricola pv. corylina]KOB02807.1 hypothetical protein AE921_05155 [Xanthomonas arboricola]KOB08701.1 hypothetical protein AE922_09865 [Xanthomonas arboricola]